MESPDNNTALITGIGPCSIDGQDDIYGLGIRVGLYLQWFCTTLAYIYDPKKATGFMAVNYIFSIAVAINSIVNRNGIAQLEVPIVAVLMMLPPTVIVAEMFGNLILYFQPSTADIMREQQERKEEKEQQEREAKEVRTAQTSVPQMLEIESAGRPTILRMQTQATQTDEAPPPPPKTYGPIKKLRDFLVLAATIFLLSISVWELFDGVDQAMLNPIGCNPMFIKSYYLHGRYNLVLKVVAVIFAVCAPIFQVFLIIERITFSGGLTKDGRERPISARRQAWREYRLSSDSTSTSSKLKAKTIFKPFKVRSFVAMLWGILASFAIAQIETIIKQNRIQGLISATEAGQLIPLIIGILQFVIVAYDVIYQEWLSRTETEEPSDKIKLLNSEEKQTKPSTVDSSAGPDAEGSWGRSI